MSKSNIVSPFDLESEEKRPLNIAAVSRSYLNRLLSKIELPENLAIISVNSSSTCVKNYPDDKVADARKSSKNVLALTFDDIETPIKDNMIPFDSDMAYQIANFARTLNPEITALFIHCDAGVSRSVAIKNALFDYLYEFDLTAIELDNTNDRSEQNLEVYYLTSKALRK